LTGEAAALDDSPKDAEQLASPEGMTDSGKFEWLPPQRGKLMTHIRKLLAIALLSTGVASPVLAQGVKGHGSMAGMEMGSTKSDARDDAFTREFKVADTAMMKDMDIPYTGDPDVDFHAHMIPHHKGAVAMARVALRHAKDPATKAMAQKIIADQATEISDMEAWLARHGK
jgi:uncharacterized protein (DUF305 family)